MYFLIESIEQLDRLDPSDECFVRVVQLNDRYHPKLSSPCLVYYNDFNKGYILSIDHSECESVPMKKVIEFLSRKKVVYVEDLKYHMYHLPIENMVDVVFDLINETGSEDCEVQSPSVYWGFYRTIKTHDVNRLIPVTKHLEYLEAKFKAYRRHCKRTQSDAFNNLLSSVYKRVEECGLGVTEGFFEDLSVTDSDYMSQDSIVYSSYNLYNITSRPSNSFNHVNFLALPKTEIRRGIIPKMDRLVEYDFDSYHLKLISDLIGYVPKSGTIDHSYMAKYYFDIEGDPTPEQYSLSKTITFKQLYGSIEQKYKSIPFYKTLTKYIDDRWDEFLDEGEFVLPTGRIIKYDGTFNRTKFFNYIVQNKETLVNVQKMKSVLDLLEDRFSQLILITYDAFLFDFSARDGQQTVLNIESILGDGGYKVRRKVGKNYFFD